MKKNPKITRIKPIDKQINWKVTNYIRNKNIIRLCYITNPQRIEKFKALQRFMRFMSSF